MAKDNWKRDRHERLEARRRWRMHAWFFHEWRNHWWTRGPQRTHPAPWGGGEVCSWARQQDEREHELMWLQRQLSVAVHLGQGRYTRRYRRQWRQAGRAMCRLHVLGEHDRAEDLDPQPHRLGVRWEIY